MRSLCKSKGIKLINNNNIDGLFLSRSKLHLNKSRTALLVKTFSKALKPKRLCNLNDSVADKTINSSDSKTSNVSLLRNLRIKNPKNIFFFPYQQKFYPK